MIEGSTSDNGGLLWDWNFDRRVDDIIHILVVFTGWHKSFGR